MTDLDKKLKPLPDELHEQIIAELRKQRSIYEEARSETFLIRVTPGLKDRLKQIAEWKTAATGKHVSMSALAFEYVVECAEADTFQLLKK